MATFVIERKMPGTGVELPPIKPQKSTKTTNSQRRGAKCGALKDKNDPDLAEIIEAWPELPGHIKAAIKALIQTHKTEKK
jgi:hypothetical protein